VIIGLLEEGLPKFGVIYRPVGDVLYAGACDEATWITTGADCRRGPGFYGYSASSRTPGSIPIPSSPDYR
jgi:hypothetical protein